MGIAILDHKVLCDAITALHCVEREWEATQRHDSVGISEALVAIQGFKVDQSVKFEAVEPGDIVDDMRSRTDPTRQDVWQKILRAILDVWVADEKKANKP